MFKPCDGIRLAMCTCPAKDFLGSEFSPPCLSTQAGVGVSWDGRRITAPSGVVGADGRMDLRPYVRPTSSRPDEVKLE